MKKSLIVGMGIGHLYKSILEEIGHQVITVDIDPTKNADFTQVEEALKSTSQFTTAHICTPNYTHETLAKTVAKSSQIVFVEKPGLIDAKCWQCLVEGYPNTRFAMVKNNMWRDNIAEMQAQVPNAKTVKIKWINKNRIPGPGTWFTNKALAWGGVSRDLMPHLLSLYISLNEHWQDSYATGYETRQRYTLDTIKDTEYGIVKRDGVYDVDDLCKIKYMKNGRVWKMEADWANGQTDLRAVDFELSDGSIKRYELGLCPESAYKNMIVDCINNLNNNTFWNDQLEKDLWIHGRIENL